MRLTLYGIVILIAALFVVGCACGKPGPNGPDPVAGRHVKISRYHTSELTDAEADRILAEANNVLATINGAGDVSCTVDLRRSGPVSTFATGDGEIDSEWDYDQIIGLPGHIKIVNAINWCSAPGAFIIGCAPVPGNSLLVVRHDPSSLQEGILWAHEYGHNCGLHHRNAADIEVLNGTIKPAHTYVNVAEKAAYEGHQPSAAGGSDPATVEGSHAGAAAAATQPATTQAAAGAPQVDVKDFVRKRYIEGVPYQEASAYKAQAVPVLIKMLDDPADAPWRPNIVTVLGAIGDPQAVDPMIKVVEEGQGKIKPVEYGAKKGAIVFLGDVIHKSQNANDPAVIKALDYLKQGATNPAIWSQRVKWESPFTQSESQRNWQLTKAAIWGLAMTGKQEAAQAIASLEGKIQGGTIQDVPADLASVLKEAKAALAVVGKQGVHMFRVHPGH